MGLHELCDRCTTGRREVKEYRLAIAAVIATQDPPLEEVATRMFVLCDEHLESLTAGIDRLITPPKKRANS